MENIIAYHCAPALAGIKPSNIVACYKNRGYDVHKEIARLNSELNCKDIYFEPLCECDKKVLLMVYRRKALKKALEKQDISEFLFSYGYPVGGDVKMYIEHLKQRLSHHDFPHEIGAFLGYPLHDIFGYMLHKDEGCLLCGEWKVYENAEEAQALFNRFSACRKKVVGKILMGRTLAEVFCAA